MNAQENINDLLAAGTKNAQNFTESYLAPVSEALGFEINNGWYNNAKAPNRFNFELSIIGNIGFIKDNKKSVEMKLANYQNIRFKDGSSSKTVATALGNNNPDVSVIITYADPIFGSQEIELTLPTGIGSEAINMVATGFLQASFSPLRGTQIKGRYVPKIESEDVKLGLYGIGLQQDFTSWLPADKILPVAISGLMAFTHLNGSYDFTNVDIVDGANQRIETNVKTFLFELIVGTKLKIINFYGGLGFVTGKSRTELLGTYRVIDGVVFSEDFIDPISLDHHISGMRATLGSNLKLGVFGTNADYTFVEFDSTALEINLSFL